MRSCHRVASAPHAPPCVGRPSLAEPHHRRPHPRSTVARAQAAGARGDVARQASRAGPHDSGAGRPTRAPRRHGSGRRVARGGRPLYRAEAFFILRRHRHVRLDVSGIPPTRLLEYFPRLPEVADRVVWGTDWPSPGVRDMRQNIDQFLALSLADSHKQAILETNALALFPPARYLPARPDKKPTE